LNDVDFLLADRYVQQFGYCHHMSYVCLSSVRSCTVTFMLTLGHRSWYQWKDYIGVPLGFEACFSVTFQDTVKVTIND